MGDAPGSMSVGGRSVAVSIINEQRFLRNHVLWSWLFTVDNDLFLVHRWVLLLARACRAVT